MTHDNVTDIVERLDELAGLCDRHVIPHAGHAAICRQAADTIATLRKQLENARAEALEQAARVAEEAPIIGSTLSSWINTNESPMGATRRHIATAIRALKGQP